MLQVATASASMVFVLRAMLFVVSRVHKAMHCRWKGPACPVHVVVKMVCAIGATRATALRAPKLFISRRVSVSSRTVTALMVNVARLPRTARAATPALSCVPLVSQLQAPGVLTIFLRRRFASRSPSFRVSSVMMVGSRFCKYFFPWSCVILY